MSERVKDIVTLAINDKPNKASNLFNDEMIDRIAPVIDTAKAVVSNQLFGQDYEEPEAQQDDDEEYLNTQEVVDAAEDDDGEEDWDDSEVDEDQEPDDNR